MSFSLALAGARRRADLATSEMKNLARLKSKKPARHYPLLSDTNYRAPNPESRFVSIIAIKQKREQKQREGREREKIKKLGTQWEKNQFGIQTTLTNLERRWSKGESPPYRPLGFALSFLPITQLTTTTTHYYSFLSFNQTSFHENRSSGLKSEIRLFFNTE